MQTFTFIILKTLGYNVNLEYSVNILKNTFFFTFHYLIYFILFNLINFIFNYA